MTVIRGQKYRNEDGSIRTVVTVREKHLGTPKNPIVKRLVIHITESEPGKETLTEETIFLKHNTLIEEEV